MGEEAVLKMVQRHRTRVSAPMRIVDKMIDALYEEVISGESIQTLGERARLSGAPCDRAALALTVLRLPEQVAHLVQVSTLLEQAMREEREAFGLKDGDGPESVKRAEPPSRQQSARDEFEKIMAIANANIARYEAQMAGKPAKPQDT